MGAQSADTRNQTKPIKPNPTEPNNICLSVDVLSTNRSQLAHNLSCNHRAFVRSCPYLVLPQALQRFRKSDEQDETYDASTTGARWAGDKHRDSSAEKSGQAPPATEALVCKHMRLEYIGLDIFRPTGSDS